MKRWIMKSVPEEMKSIELDISDDVFLKLACKHMKKRNTQYSYY